MGRIFFRIRSEPPRDRWFFCEGWKRFNERPGGKYWECYNNIINSMNRGKFALGKRITSKEASQEVGNNE